MGVDPKGNPPSVGCGRCNAPIPCRPYVGRARLRELQAMGVGKGGNIVWSTGDIIDLCAACQEAFAAWLLEGIK